MARVVTEDYEKLLEGGCNMDGGAYVGNLP